MLGWTMAFNRLHSLNRVKLKLYTLLTRSLLNYRNIKSIHSRSENLWKVVFYGTDEFSEDTLKALHLNWRSSSLNKCVESLEVVCIESDCPVKRYASQNKLTIHLWPYDIPANVYDVGVVVSFGHMIPAESILSCKYGIINAHPSLLPRWRGAAPIIHSILNGDAETGVTITQVSPNKFDVGNILLQEKYTIPPGCSSKALRNDLSQMASHMIIKTLQNLSHYYETSIPQEKEGTTKAPKIKPHKCYINWEQDSALSIYRKFKAFAEFYDLFTFWKDMKVIVLECENMENTEKANVSSLVGQESIPPGFCYFHKRRKVIFVKCKDGWYGIMSMKLPRKGKISAQDFYNGFISKEEQNSYFHTNKCTDITK